MNFQILDNYWYTNIHSKNVLYEIMNYYGRKYEDYIYAYTICDKFHVIHEIAGYYFNRNEEFT